MNDDGCIQHNGQLPLQARQCVFSFQMGQLPDVHVCKCVSISCVLIMLEQFLGHPYQSAVFKVALCRIFEKKQTHT